MCKAYEGAEEQGLGAFVCVCGEPRRSIFNYAGIIERAFSASTVEGIVSKLANEIHEITSANEKLANEEKGLDPAPLTEMLSSMAAACPLSLKVALRRMQTADMPLPEWLLEKMEAERMDEEDFEEAKQDLEDTMKEYILAEAEHLGMEDMVPAMEHLLLHPWRRKRPSEWAQLIQQAVAHGVDQEAVTESLQALLTESNKGKLELDKQLRLLTHPPELGTEGKEGEEGDKYTMMKSLADTLRLDFQMTQHFLNNANFLEGVCVHPMSMSPSVPCDDRYTIVWLEAIPSHQHSAACGSPRPPTRTRPLVGWLWLVLSDIHGGRGTLWVVTGAGAADRQGQLAALGPAHVGGGDG